MAIAYGVGWTLEAELLGDQVPVLISWGLLAALTVERTWKHRFVDHIAS